MCSPAKQRICKSSRKILHFSCYYGYNLFLPHLTIPADIVSYQSRCLSVFSLKLNHLSLTWGDRYSSRHREYTAAFHDPETERQTGSVIRSQARDIWQDLWRNRRPFKRTENCTPISWIPLLHFSTGVYFPQNSERAKSQTRISADTAFNWRHHWLNLILMRFHD